MFSETIMTWDFLDEPNVITLKRRTLESQVEYWRDKWEQLFVEHAALKRKLRRESAS